MLLSAVLMLILSRLRSTKTISDQALSGPTVIH
jgi:hypothetical protein